jgi:signal transduction histidine kinase
MSAGLQRALTGLALVWVVLAALVIVVLVDSPWTDDPGQLNAFAPVISASFVFVGLFAWARRPENRTGALMVAVGFLWLVSTLIVARQPGLYITGWLFYVAPYAVILHLLIAFPSGRLEGRLERFLVAGSYLICVVFQVAEVLVFSPDGTCGCGLKARPNPIVLWPSDTAFDILAAVQSAVSVVALAAIGWLLAQRWRRASTAQRHVVTPVYGAAVLLVTTLILTLIADIFADQFATVENAVDVIGRLALAFVPFGFLIGLVRSRLSRAVAVSELVERLSAAPQRRRTLTEALADALADPTLSLAYRVGERYVDASGHEVALPDGGWTPVEREGRPVGAIVHSPDVAREDPAALRAVAGAAALALENERLDAELRARIEELRESRARIVRASDEGRRRLERDLHDGAQQRLVAIALTLRLARNRAAHDPAVAELLDEAAAELGAATDELRELARGIHPAVLADRGLEPAIGTLAGRSAVPVEVTEVPAERLPQSVEAAAYFVVAEALTNVARYAQASHASVSVARVNGSVTVEVSDDGVGGADPASGSGLRGLADRVAALDGRLEVSSPAGAGTTVRAVLPCGS